MKYVIFLLFAADTVVAQSSVLGQSDARAKKIIDDAIQALGGSAFLEMQDRVETGRAYSYYREQISGLTDAKIYTRYLSVPPSQTGSVLGERERMAYGVREDAFDLYREDGAWEVSWRGARAMDNERITRFKDTTLRNIFYILRMRLKEPGMIFEYRGSDVFDNLPVDKVDITDSEDRVETVYFHQSSKLPVRQSFKWLDEKMHQQNEEVTVFTRYLEAGGVIWPHGIHRERNGDKIFEIFSTKVTIDQGLADNLFSLAVGVKTLK